jgi:uncharacterized protein YjbI with pentapeptide repeats
MGLLPNSPVFHREHTPGTMKPQHRNKKMNDPAARTAPEIPADIQHLTPMASIVADAEISFRECLIENFSFKNHSYESVIFEGCVLKHLDFSRGNVRGLRLKDVRLIECDFANTEIIGLKAVRVEFINCRLTGLRAVESEWQDLLVSDGDASFLNFDWEPSRQASSTGATLQKLTFTAATCVEPC